MSAPGWYPDPAGQPGLYRYWTGTAWTDNVSNNPGAATPGAAGAPGTAPQSPWQAHQGSQPAAAAQKATSKSGVGTWLTIGAVVLVVGVALWFLVPRLLGAIGIGGTDNPVSNPTTNVCPRISGTPTASANAHPNDGRVYGGKLSYPLLGSPWEAPEPEYRVAFGRDAQSQIIVVEPNYDGTSSWVASVLVADLIAGDGFFGPEQGSKIVAKCIVGAFYGSAAVNRTDITNKATTVDGRAAWELEMHLTFNIPGLKTKGETAIVVIVSTGTDSASIYYASIPDTVPQYLQPARDLIPQLKVSP
ncbi:MAG: DUF2510 domain-containing protein [Propionibacteriaceae bacterium]|nr:DUF2510 domain-containing protein [Micropruina sp.]HBX80996.1 hypothetical protein [Propionibacteriaceae bacterium]HBY21991.1 hypothetical protein [Propionibacteriaceae bacterium]